VPGRQQSPWITSDEESGRSSRTFEEGRIVRRRRRGELLFRLNIAKQRGRACRQNAGGVPTTVRMNVLQRLVAVIVMI
jgi:hypothetical protein